MARVKIQPSIMVPRFRLILTPLFHIAEGSVCSTVNSETLAGFRSSKTGCILSVNEVKELSVDWNCTKGSMFQWSINWEIRVT